MPVGRWSTARRLPPFPPGYRPVPGRTTISLTVAPEQVPVNDFTGDASTTAVTATLTATGTMDATQGATATAITVTLSAAGVVGKIAGTTATAETVTLTSAGAVGITAGASATAETVTLTSSGVVGKVAGTTALTETVTSTATGIVGKVADTTATAETVTLTSAGEVGKVIGAATTAVTVTLSAAGTAVAPAGDFTGGASATDVTATITAGGVSDMVVPPTTVTGGSGYYPARPLPPEKPRGVRSGAQSTSRVMIFAAGTLGVTSQTSRLCLVETSAAGVVGLQGRAHLDITTTTRLRHDRTLVTTESELRRLRDDADLMLML